MALFKPLRGTRVSLPQELHDGYAYFCTDDGSFHIDYVDADGNLQRKQINAKEAEMLCGMTLDEIKAYVAVQSDWSQNDETATDYIKNRPFYEQYICVTDASRSTETQLFVTRMDQTKTYRVEYKGQIFEDVPVIEGYATTATLGIGDKFVTPPVDWQGTDYGFYIFYYKNSWKNGVIENQLMNVAINPDIIADTIFDPRTDIKIWESVPELKQIEQKFVPNSDWSVNDENADGYVKNRTHYTIERSLLASLEMLQKNDTYYTADNADASNVIRGFINDGNSTVDVFINGVLYKCKAQFSDGYYIINLDGSTSVGQGIVISIRGSTANIISLYTDSFGIDAGADTHTVEIYTTEVVQQLDQKYIPGMHIKEINNDGNMTNEEFLALENGVYFIHQNPIDGTSGLVGVYDGYWICYDYSSYYGNLYIEEGRLVAGEYGALDGFGFEDAMYLYSCIFPNDIQEGQTVVASFNEFGEPVFKAQDLLEQVQSDWSQCDETADDYIKNRTHYEGVKEIVVAPSTEIKNRYSILLEDVSLLEVGKQCVVTIDGVRYETTIRENVNLTIGTGVNTYDIGIGSWMYLNTSPALVRVVERVDNCPFSLVLRDNELLFAYETTDATNDVHTVEVCVKNYELHQLDEKYIPNTIARVSDIPTQIQVDWNQNDESASDYIKNKPFFLDINETSIVTDVTSEYECGEGNPYTSLLSMDKNLFRLTQGQTYRVIFDGVPYVCTAIEMNYGAGLGNMALPIDSDTPPDGFSSIEHNDTGEPFAIFYVSYDHTYNRIYATTSGSHTFSVSEYEETIHQLDEKYIPDTIARVSEIPKQIQSDWSVNDEANPAYVQNRPFYKTTEYKTYDLSEIVDGFELLPGFEIPAAGENVILNVNGVDTEYTVVSDMTGDYIGNRTFTQEEMENGFSSGWCIYFDTYNQCTCLFWVNSTDTLVIPVVNITPIPEEFLPKSKLVLKSSSYNTEEISSEDLKNIQVSVPVLNGPYGDEEIVCSPDGELHLRHNYAVPVDIGKIEINSNTLIEKQFTIPYAGGTFQKLVVVDTYTKTKCEVIIDTANISGINSSVGIIDKTYTQALAYINGTLFAFETNAIDQDDTTPETLTLTVRRGLPTATTSEEGMVRLTNSTSSTSTTTAATPSSVKAAYDLASSAMTTIESIKPKMTTITIPATNWTGDSDPWSQVVTINGVTANSKIDLQPTAHQIVSLRNEEVSLMISNENGVVTAWAVGNKPTVDYTMQVLITEVTYI